MKKVNVREEVMKHSFIGSLLLTAMSAASSDLGKFSKDGELNLAKEDSNSFDDVKLVVNGVEVSIRPFADELEKQYTNLVNKAAQELLKEKFSSLDDTLYNIREIALHKLKEEVGDW